MYVSMIAILDFELSLELHVQGEKVWDTWFASKTAYIATCILFVT